jgi:hypothetical protein
MDYAPRLQVLDERPYYDLEPLAPWLTPGPTLPDLPPPQSRARGFSYTAKLKNMGAKTLEIQEVLMAYGSEADAKKREREVLALFLVQPEAITGGEQP